MKVFDYTLYDVITNIFSNKAAILIPRSYTNTLMGKVLTVPVESEPLIWGAYYNPENEIAVSLLHHISKPKTEF